MTIAALFCRKLNETLASRSKHWYVAAINSVVIVAVYSPQPLSITRNIARNLSVALKAYGLRPGRVVKIVGVPSLTRGGSVRAAPVAGFRGHAVENTNESGGATRVSAVKGDDITGKDVCHTMVAGGP